MRSTAAAALAAMLALSAAACSLPGSGTTDQPPASAPPASAPASAPASDPAGGPSADPASPSASDAPSASTSGSSSAGPTPADPDQPSGDQLGAAVATRASADGGKKVTLQLYPLQRDGRTSHLNLTLASAGDLTQRVQVSGLLSDGNYSAIDKSGLAADGLQLVDGKNAKLYLVASDGQGQCLCSRDLSSVFLSKGAPVLFSATFAAPPADVTQVDVRVPSFGTVKNVPVQ